MKEDYPSFMLWYDYTRELFFRTGLFPKTARFSLGVRMENHALDILSLLTKAIYTNEKRSLLRQINIKLEELRILTRLSYDLKMINEKVYGNLNHKTETFGKMIGGWEKKVKNV